MLFGVSLLAVVVGAGFSYWGKQCLRKRSPSPGMAMAQHWVAFVCYLVSGMAWAVAAWPLVGLVGWTWLIVGSVFFGLGLAIGTGVDIAADHKPDRPAFWAARVLPLLMLISALHWAAFTHAVTDQIHTYQSHMSAQR